MFSERIGRRPILLGGLAATSIVYLELDLVAVGRPSFSGRGQWSLLINVGSMLLFYMRIRNHTVD